MTFSPLQISPLPFLKHRYDPVLDDLRVFLCHRAYDPCRVVVDEGYGAAVSRCTLYKICVAGSYILASNASNTVEFDMPAYLGLYPSFLVALLHLLDTSHTFHG